MKPPHEIESWALGVIERATSQLTVEDSRVEIKNPKILPKHEDLARKIAAHANGARLSPMLWVFGVNEKSGSLVSVPSGFDFNDWWAQIRSHFEGQHVPRVKEVLFPKDGKNILAVYMEPTQPPYLVKPSRMPDWEVPWREGTSTRTARHADLVEMLIPVATATEFTDRGVTLTVKRQQHREGTRWDVELRWRVYLVPAATETEVLARHDAAVSLSDNLGTVIDFEEEEILLNPAFYSRADPGVRVRRSPSMDWTGETLIVKHPGLMECFCSQRLRRTQPFSGSATVHAELLLKPLNGPGVSLRTSMHSRSSAQSGGFEWGS